MIITEMCIYICERVCVCVCVGVGVWALCSCVRAYVHALARARRSVIVSVSSALQLNLHDARALQSTRLYVHHGLSVCVCATSTPRESVLTWRPRYCGRCLSDTAAAPSHSLKVRSIAHV